MVSLPHSIENALKDAGLSPTEILILNHLLSEEGMTLRELAAKTGKSTGVLDQAMKKLLRRRIVERQTINDTPKYIVGSLQAIVDWMERDTQQRRDDINRRYQNFESFIMTLERERSRPHVEHFDGFEGIKRAYSKLLEFGSSDIVGFVPQLFKEEDDPLREFKVQWFRERYNKGAFLRIITHEGPLGRRYHSRDAFEYRKSLLVSPERHPIVLEKYIVNGVLATIDYDKRAAMFLHYPELARNEREAFEHLWQVKTAEREAGIAAMDKRRDTPPSPEPRKPEGIAVRTKLLSLAREFFVSPKSWVAIGLCAVIAASLSFTIHTTTVRINTERIRERVMAIASTATVEFRPEELNRLRTMKDVGTPAYQSVLRTLQQIRRRNPDVMYAYLLRPSANGTLFEFIADADAEDPAKVPDTNNDGVITPADDLGFPGVQYDVGYIDVLRDREYEVPVATREPYTDKWGTFFTGYAPIRDASGNLVALVAIDMTGDDLADYNRQTYRPLLGFAVLFVLFIILRFSASNSSVLGQLFPVFARLRRPAVFLSVALAAACIVGLLLWRQREAIIRTYGEKAKAIAATAAVQFSPDDLAVLHKAEDMRRPEYQRVFRQLNEIRNQNPGVTYVEIFRKTETDGIWEFVADADANFDMSDETDVNADGVFDDKDENPWPGMAYYVGEEIKAIPTKPYYELNRDQWGDLLSGNAPIFDAQGNAIAELDVNFELRSVLKKEAGAMFSWLIDEAFLASLRYFVAILAAMLVIRFIVVNRRTLLAMIPCTSRRTVAFGAVCLLCVALLAFLAFRHMRLEAAKRVLGERAQAIAATAALQISADDLAVLHKAEDMRRPEYQKVFRILNDVRNQNPDILYVTIFRPTSVDGLWEFVADADANYDVFHSTDTNADGVLDDKDENPWPGMAYDAKGYSEEAYAKAFRQPYFVESSDQWGNLLSGNAPIFDASGKVIAEIAVNFDADSVVQNGSGNFLRSLALPLSRREVLLSLPLFALLLSAYFLFIFRETLAALLPVLQVRRILLFTAFIVLCGVFIVQLLEHKRNQSRIRALGERAQAIAATAALLVDARDLEVLHQASDMQRPEYQKVFRILNDVRNQNPDILYVYIFRPTRVDGVWEFVVDADSNYHVPTLTDVNGDGKLDETDASVWPGFSYDVHNSPDWLQNAFHGPMYILDSISDQWGFFITGSAPIFDAQGNAVAILGVDFPKTLH